VLFIFWTGSIVIPTPTTWIYRRFLCLPLSTSFSSTMLFKAGLIVSSLLIVAIGNANAHAVISPALGVVGQPIRADAQRPKKSSPCGKMDIASNIDTTEPIIAAADGSFSTQIQNFNRLIDGSRSISGTVDPTGTGNSFAGKVTMTQNGSKAPFELGTEPIAATLPAGTKCTGGASGNLCLVSFKSISGFGNCVVVQMGDATGTAGNGTTTTTTGTAGNTSTTGGEDASGTTTTGTAGNTSTTDGADTSGTDIGSDVGTQAGSGKTTTTGGTKAQGGTRAARSALFARKEVKRRSVWNWVWA
jgi:hypothetical protein